MITLEPLSETRLGTVHQIAVGAGGHVAAISMKGSGWLLPPDHRTVTAFDIPAGADGVAVDPRGEVVAVTARGSIHALAGPKFKPLFVADDAYDCVCFSSDGGLWAATHCDDRTGILRRLMDPGNEAMVEASFEDPFGDSRFMLFPHPDPRCVAIWAAAGQNGCCIFSGRLQQSGLWVERFADLSQTSVPAFSASGDRLLCSCNSGELRDYDFASGALRSTSEWHSPTDSEWPGDICAYVGNNRALWNSSSYRLYLMDLERSALLDEVCIRGHEPIRTDQLYPKLKGDASLCGDMVYFTALSGRGFASLQGESVLTWALDGA